MKQLLAQQPIKKRKPQFFSPLYLVSFVLVAGLIIRPFVVENRWLHLLTTNVLGDITGHNNNNHIILTVNDEYALQLYMHNQRTALLQNASGFVDHWKLYMYPNRSALPSLAVVSCSLFASSLLIAIEINPHLHANK